MCRRLLGLGLCICMITTSVQVVPAAVKAGSKFKVQYMHGKKKKYNKKAINARFNGTVISTKMPGVVYKSNAMYSAYYTFKKCSALKTSYSYSKSTGKITMKRGSKTLVMRVNSSYATLNGKTVKLSVPPRKMRYVAKKKNYIMVPGSSVASKLGLNYSWKQSNYSGYISIPSSTSTTYAGSGSSLSPQPVTPNTKQKADSSNYNVRMKTPSGLAASDLAVIDDYNNRRLIVKIKGNYYNHFNSSANRYIKADSYFRYYSVAYSGGYTYVYIRPRKDAMKAYAVSFSSSYIYVKYDTPKSMYNRIVVLDAGHGGTDSGAVGNGLREKDLTLDIVLKAKSYFDRNGNYKVYYTRTSDTYPSLTARSDLANKVSADRFISVHINSYTSSSTGTETLYNSNGYKSSTGLTSYKLSSVFHPQLRSSTGFRNRGLVNRTGLAVLRNTKTASTLGEVGFITNKSEATYMKNNTSKIGYGVYKGILGTF